MHLSQVQDVSANGPTSEVGRNFKRRERAVPPLPGNFDVGGHVLKCSQYAGILSYKEACSLCHCFKV